MERADPSPGRQVNAPDDGAFKSQVLSLTEQLCMTLRSKGKPILDACATQIERLIRACVG